MAAELGRFEAGLFYHDFSDFMLERYKMSNFTYRSSHLCTHPPPRIDRLRVPAILPDVALSVASVLRTRKLFGVLLSASSFFVTHSHPAQAMEVLLTDAPAGGFTFDNVQRYAI